MRNNFKMLRIAVIAPIMGLCFTSCKKDKTNQLGTIAKADFVAVPSSSNPNDIILVNKSSTASIPLWKIGNSSSKLTGDSAKTNFLFAGTYQITLYVISNGGLDSVTKAITVAQNDPSGCLDTKHLGFITSCTSKKWKLDPDASAYKVGPGPNDGSWWSSGLGDVGARSCEFNDEYVFAYGQGATATFKYDNKGDFFGDGYMGDNTGSCQPSSNYTAVQAPWGSGNFTYSFSDGGGVNHLGQITVIGLGAHIGLQKVRNGGEVTSGPTTSITYDILAQTKGATYDLLTLGVDIGGGAWWTFRLRSY